MSDPVGFFPYTLPWDDAPLDLSWMYADEAPAGKHGFLRAENGRFAWPDGRPARFWGTLLNSAACFPTHEQAEVVAARLAKFGVNIVRLHQFDSEWATPNIFQLNKGQPLDSSRKLDPECLDRLHYLIHCLKQRGIYIYMDLMVYRTFKPDDEVDNLEELPPNGAKPYGVFDPRLIELQKEYAKNLIAPVNPYTGLALVDDPAMAVVLIANEYDIFASYHSHCSIEPYRSRLEKRMRAWAAENGLAMPEKVDFNYRDSSPDAVHLRFGHEVMRDYYAQMRAFLREMGVKVPIAGNSWCQILTQTSSTGDMDFASNNVYWDLCGDGCQNIPLVAERDNQFLEVMAKTRTAHQPQFISEWDMTWPHEWRAMSAPMVAAAAAFQDWGGATIHTYRYHNGPAFAMGAPVLDGVPYRQNFETFIDPAKFGLFYAAGVLFRRGDVQPGRELVRIALDDKDLFENPRRGGPEAPALRNVEKHRIELVLPDHAEMPAGAPAPLATLRADDEGPAGEDRDGVLSDTGEIYRSWKDRRGWIDTPRSKILYGFFSPSTPVELKGLTVTMRTDFATLCFTSLTDQPLVESRQILVTAVGRADNSGARYNPSRSVRASLGGPPILMEAIDAEIDLENRGGALRVWSVNPRGGYTGKVPVTREGDRLKFRLGPLFPSLYYLITR